MKHARLWKNVILWAISWREISLASGCHLLIKIDQPSCRRITRRNYKHIPQIVCVSSRFRVLHLLSWNLSDPKSSKDTLLYLYVIYNMLKSAELHETILTPVICNKHVRCHDGVTLYFSVKFLSVVPKKTRNGHFSIYQQISRILSKNNQKKERDWKLRLNVRKHIHEDFDFTEIDHMVRKAIWSTVNVAL